MTHAEPHPIERDEQGSDQPAIAVLVPVLNEEACIGRLLQQVTDMGADDSGFAEIIVADGGSTDLTREIVSGFEGVRLIETARGRGLQIAAALQASRSPLIAIVHADTVLPPTMPRLIRNSLALPSVAAGCFNLAFDRRSPLLDIYAWLTRFDSRLTTFGDQVYFTSRAALHAAGGIPEWPLLEDVELRRRLQRVGRFEKRPETVIVSARRFERLGNVKAQAINAMILGGYSLGVSVERLAALYRR